MSERTHAWIRWCAPLWALTTIGCVPWALGPSRVSTSVGGSLQVADDGVVEGSTAVLTRVEADATQLVTDAAEREGDLGLGLVHLDYLGGRRQSEARTGATISGRWFAHRFEAGDATGRLSLGLHADVFWRSTGFGGAGGTAAFELEIADGVGTGDFFDADANEDGLGFVGGGYTGEVGFGIRAELGYHALDDGTHRWTATLGLVFRIPVLGGFVGGIPFPD